MTLADTSNVKTDANGIFIGKDGSGECIGS